MTDLLTGCGAGQSNRIAGSRKINGAISLMTRYSGFGIGTQLSTRTIGPPSPCDHTSKDCCHLFVEPHIDHSSANRDRGSNAVHQLKAAAGAPAPQTADPEQEPKSSIEIKPAARNDAPATEATSEPLEANPSTVHSHAQQTT